jgi:hypothetical protein
MNTLELDHCLKKNKFTKKIYGGTFAVDLTPLRGNKKPIFYVINTQPSSQQGEHWLGLYITNNTFELFDSGGRSFESHPYIKKIIKILFKEEIKKITFNKKQIQAYESDLCGHFVCLFAFSKK